MRGGSPEVECCVVQAGLEVQDGWVGRRGRQRTVEAYLESMRGGAGHIIGDQSEDDVAAYRDQVEAAMREASGPRGWTYDFTKLYAIARKPG